MTATDAPVTGQAWDLSVPLAVLVVIVIISCAVALWRDQRSDDADITDRVLDAGSVRHALFYRKVER